MTSYLDVYLAPDFFIQLPTPCSSLATFKLLCTKQNSCFYSPNSLPLPFQAKIIYQITCPEVIFDSFLSISPNWQVLVVNLSLNYDVTLKMLTIFLYPPLSTPSFPPALCESSPFAWTTTTNLSEFTFAYLQNVLHKAGRVICIKT